MRNTQHLDQTPADFKGRSPQPISLVSVRLPDHHDLAWRVRLFTYLEAV
jgi:hypothetical protein